MGRDDRAVQPAHRDVAGLNGAPALVLACAGCGQPIDGDAAYPFRCPRAGADDGDHVVACRPDVARLSFPCGDEAHPFLRFRSLLHAWHRARAGGLTDADYVGLVERLDRGVTMIEGHGFRFTPFAPSPALAAALGLDGARLWVKDETGNVGGSHKARHLMGVALHLEVVERLGLARPEDDGGPALAIASCGNAALAAAVVARAAGRSLAVFVPPAADRRVIALLERLDARVEVCARDPGRRGDPSVARFRRAVAEGAIPFGCQGSDNGLAIEGGQTLAWEMVETLRAAPSPLDRLFVQVGGGALASASLQALATATALGALPRMPRVHAVQAVRCHPLSRAYARVRERVLARLEPGGRGAGIGSPTTCGEDELLADRMRAPDARGAVEEALAWAAAHRSEFMWPWESTPESIAGGILDDETYDWLAVVRGMIESGGFPLRVSEEALEEAHRVARDATGIPVSATGSAGLAGLIELLRGGCLSDHETLAVLFTGVQR